LERAARADDAETKLDKLDALIAASSASPDGAAIFAEMLSLPNDGRYPVRDLSPSQRRQMTMEALIAQIEAVSRQTPVLMIFGDAHWAYPSGLEVLGRLVDKIDPATRCLVCHLSTGIRRALGRTSARDGPHDQPARFARDDRADRPRRRSTRRCQPKSGRISSSGPMGPVR
jgi:hypothetical protein